VQCRRLSLSQPLRRITRLIRGDIARSPGVRSLSRCHFVQGTDSFQSDTRGWFAALQFRRPTRSPSYRTAASLDVISVQSG